MVCRRRGGRRIFIQLHGFLKPRGSPPRRVLSSVGLLRRRLLLTSVPQALLLSPALINLKVRYVIIFVIVVLSIFLGRLVRLDVNELILPLSRLLLLSLQSLVLLRDQARKGQLCRARRYQLLREVWGAETDLAAVEIQAV